MGCSNRLGKMSDGVSGSGMQAWTIDATFYPEGRTPQKAIHMFIKDPYVLQCYQWHDPHSPEDPQMPIHSYIDFFFLKSWGMFIKNDVARRISNPSLHGAIQMDPPNDAGVETGLGRRRSRPTLKQRADLLAIHCNDLASCSPGFLPCKTAQVHLPV